MRFYVIKQDTSLKSLAPQLLKKGRAGATAVDRLKEANPHLDTSRIRKGTVVLVPDSSDFKAEGQQPGASGFTDFVSEATSALRAGGSQIRAALALREEQDKEVAKVLKSAALRKRAADDSQLRKHMESASNRSDADAKAAKETLSHLDALEKGIASELKKLQKLTG